MPFCRVNQVAKLFVDFMIHLASFSEISVEKDATLLPLLNLASNTLLVTVVGLLSVGVIKRVSKTIKSKPTLKEEDKKAN